MRETVFKTLEKNGIDLSGRNVTVCVSGGADSMALLYFLHEHAEELGIRELTACHFNHGLRGEESDGEEDFVRGSCAKLDVPLFVGYGHMSEREQPKGQSTEMWARALRYEYIRTVCRERDSLAAVAHNLNDSIETVLFNLSRGSGIRGLRGIRPEYEGVIRPFIEVPRAEIEAYCREKNISFVTDSSNLSDIYSRNIIRHAIVPGFEQLNDGFLGNAKRLTEHASDAYAYIGRACDRLIADAKTEDGYRTDAFQSADPYIARCALKQILDGQFDAVEEKMVEECLPVALGEKAQAQIRRSAFLTAEDGSFRIRFKEPPEEVPKAVTVLADSQNAFGRYLVCLQTRQFNRESEKDPVSGKTPKFIDFDKVRGRLVLRCRRPGDTFSSAVRGNTKGLKKLFQEAGIGAGERDRIPLLCDDSGIIWIPGQGPSAAVCSDGKTVKIIHIAITERKDNASGC